MVSVKDVPTDNRTVQQILCDATHHCDCGAKSHVCGGCGRHFGSENV